MVAATLKKRYTPCSKTQVFAKSDVTPSRDPMIQGSSAGLWEKKGDDLSSTYHQLLVEVMGIFLGVHLLDMIIYEKLIHSSK